MKRLLLAVGALLFALPLAACKPDEAKGPNRNVRFGLPAAAGTEREAYLIERPQYVLSYNARTRTPNWVCWRLAREDIGKAARGPFVGPVRGTADGEQRRRPAGVPEDELVTGLEPMVRSVTASPRGGPRPPAGRADGGPAASSPG
jgi:hypothetical protein